jgi:hypothetical protein
MAKKRKTREQKQVADLRHTFEHKVILNSFAANVSPVKNSPKIQVNNTSAYPYLAKDLSKTILVTLSILAVQLVLFLTLKLHLIKIPGLPY